MNKDKTAVAQAFGVALREARKRDKLSQEELALESDIDRTFVSMLERGVRQPALSTIFSLCGVLSTTPAKLVERTATLIRTK